MKVLKKLPLLAWIIIAIASGVLIGMLTPGMISGINDATGAAIPTDLIVQIFRLLLHRIQRFPELRDSADYYRLHRARHWFPRSGRR